MKNNHKKNDEEKVNETKSNISQNESHQPLNSEFQQNINFRLLNQNNSNLFQKGKKKDQQSNHQSKNSKNHSSISSQKRIQSNKEYKEDQKENSYASKESKSNKKKEDENDILEDYIILETLGEGTFGKVRLAIHKITKEKVN